MLFLLLLLCCMAIEANVEHGDCVMEEFVDLEEKFEKCCNELYQEIEKNNDVTLHDLCININMIETACVDHLKKCFGEDYISNKVDAQIEKQEELFAFANLKHSECQTTDIERANRKRRKSRY